MHAILLSGGTEAAKARARRLAAELLCQSEAARPCGVCRHCRKVLRGDFPGIHPDVSLVERQPNAAGKLRREITVDQIRALGVDALVLPNEAERKVYILPEADTMNLSAQNAFLKLLEEPPSHVSFLLCAQNRAALLETVRSRCAEERLGGESAEVSEQARARAEGFLDVRSDRAELLRWAAAAEKLDAAALTETLGCLRAQAVGTIASAEELLYLEAFLARAEQYLGANIGVKHVAGYLSTFEYVE